MASKNLWLRAVGIAVAAVLALGVAAAAAAPPTVTVSSESVSEGGVLTFTIQANNPEEDDVTVGYTTSAGSAGTADNDYVGKSGELTLEPGDSQHEITVQTVEDSKREPDETFVLRVTDGTTEGSPMLAQGTGTIENDDPIPTISIDDEALDEGNAGTTTFTFTVSLSNPSSSPVSVVYTTQPGSATTITCSSQTPGCDFQSKSTTLTIPAGSLSQTVTVTVYGDTANEPNEQFFVNLSTPANATIADGQGIGTIQNDDATPATPTATISDVAGAEGNTGQTGFAFIVTLTPTVAPVSITYATQSGSAVVGSDFVSTSGTVSFGASTATQTRAIVVPVNGDTGDEPDETFTVTLTGVSSGTATITDGQGVGTIENDDSTAPPPPPPSQPTIGINDVSSVEGANNATKTFSFIVSLSHAYNDEVLVAWSAKNGTAAAPGDYEPSGAPVLIFAVGETSKTILVTVKGDGTVEPDETFTIELSQPSNATIADGTGTGTIVNDDAALTVNDPVLDEGTIARFIVTISPRVGHTVTVAYATASGPDYPAAVQGADFDGASGTLQFAPGETTRFVDVLLKDDQEGEANERFLFTLSNASGASITKGTATALVYDNDAAPGSPPPQGAPGPQIQPGDPGPPPTGGPAVLAAGPTMAIGTRIATLKGRIVSIKLTCPRTASARCAGVVNLQTTAARPVTLGSAQFSIPLSRTQTVKIRLTAPALKFVLRARRVRVRARVIAISGSSAAGVSTAFVTLNAGKAKAPAAKRKKPPTFVLDVP